MSSTVARLPSYPTGSATFGLLARVSRAPIDAGRSRSVVRVFERDPDLLRGLSDADAREATVRGVARTAHLPKGKWRPRARAPEEIAGQLGLLVLDGMLARNTILDAVPCSELLGPGDLLRPWQHEGALATLPYEADWDVLQPATLALLDGRFAQTICSWPPVFAALLERMMERQRWISLQVTVAQLRRVDARVLIILWHLGDRWGKARADGVHLPMRLTHAFLARLIGAQRPSVTLALSQLTEQGRVRRDSDGSWVLCRPAPTLPALLRQPGGRRSDALPGR